MIAVLLAAIAFLRCKGEMQYADEIARLEAELDNCERIECRIEQESTTVANDELYVVTDDELVTLSPIWHKIFGLLRTLERSGNGINTSIARNSSAFCYKLLNINVTQVALCDIRLAVREEISGIEKKIDSLKVSRQRERTHDANGEIPIAQAAIDFGVSRQTIHNWEKYETESSLYNKSNQYGYYAALRKDSNLREAYYKLVKIVQNYNKAKSAFEKNGKRFRVKFAPFQEGWMSRQIKQT